MDNNEKIKSGEMPIRYREVKPYWVRGITMTDEKMAEKWVTVNTGFNPKEPLGKIAVRTYLAGLKAGIGKLRYCCTCKKWKECKVVSMYGICADWEIKE